VLLAAWARARSETELPRLVLVGGGPEVDRFRRTAERLGLGDVEFAGRRPREGLAALMRRAVFFVSPSRNERFALVVAEAIASGTPVVSTRVGGPEEYVTDEVGLLVEPGDVDGLAAAIVRIAREAGAHDPATLHGYVERRFGFAAVRRQLVELYSSLLERRAPARGSRRRR
jgi:glycosyltransferase involved in cell wall biosynthesis